MMTTLRVIKSQKTHLRYSSEGLIGHSSRKSTSFDGLLKGRGSLASTRLSTSASLNMQSSVSRELFASPGQSIENASPEDASETLSLAKGPTISPTKVEEMTIEDNEENLDADKELQTVPYELLKVSSGTTLASIDVTRREAYLSTEDFKAKFGMKKNAFYNLPKWKQNKLKQALNLF